MPSVARYRLISKTTHNRFVQSVLVNPRSVIAFEWFFLTLELFLVSREQGFAIKCKYFIYNIFTDNAAQIYSVRFRSDPISMRRPDVENRDLWMSIRRPISSHFALCTATTRLFTCPFVVKSLLPITGLILLTFLNIIKFTCDIDWPVGVKCDRDAT